MVNLEPGETFVQYRGNGGILRIKALIYGEHTQVLQIAPFIIERDLPLPLSYIFSEGLDGNLCISWDVFGKDGDLCTITIFPV